MIEPLGPNVLGVKMIIGPGGFFLKNLFMTEHTLLGWNSETQPTTEAAPNIMY